MLDEALFLEISNLARQLKFKPKIIDDQRVINRMATSIWFKNMELTIVGSTSSSARPVHDQINVVDAAKTTGVNDVSPHSR